MSQQAAKRRRAQAKNGYGHMSPQDRPHYKHRNLVNLHLAIERERIKAARMAAAKKK
jgi:hypothetical protein